MNVLEQDFPARVRKPHPLAKLENTIPGSELRRLLTRNALQQGVTVHHESGDLGNASLHSSTSLRVYSGRRIDRFPQGLGILPSCAGGNAGVHLSS